MKKNILYILLILIVFVLTFPNLIPIYGTGLDNSYTWAFNWLFANNYNTLITLIYPLGPLYFLKTPTTESNNLLIFLIFYTIIKLMFISLMFCLSKKHKTNILPTTILIYITSLFITIDYIIIFNCLLLCLFAFDHINKTKSTLLFTLSALLGNIGLFIKSSIGISALSITGMCWLIVSIKNKKLILSGLQLISMSFVCFLSGVIIFKSIGNFIHFLNGTIHLISGYGETMNILAKNNWILLLSGLLMVLCYPFVSGNKKIYRFYLVMIIPLYCTWKHAMVREDFCHYPNIIYFLIVFWSILAVINQPKILICILFGLISINFLYINGYNTFSNTVVHYYFNRPAYFYNYLFHFNETKTKYKILSENTLKIDKLPKDIINEIGNKTIDFYPYEHSFAPANGLEKNWKPRKTVELGASTSAWASLLAAQNFTAEAGVDYVLWHLKYFDRTTTLDNRYFLNDEPNVVFNILNNYDTVKTINNTILFKKHNHKNNLNIIQTDKEQIVKFNQWIDITPDNNKILRIKVKSKPTLIGKIKSFFYKAEIYYIDYKTSDNRTYTYRYIPSLAIDGLWVNPLITFNKNEIIKNNITQIRFRNSGNYCVKDNISIQKEVIIQ